MPRSESSCLILTSRFGATTSSFIRASKSVPPARIAPSSPSKVATCSLLVGLTYSNACMGTSLLQRFQHAIRRQGQERHTHAYGVGHGIGDRSARRNHRRLSQADDAALVVAFAGHHVHL